MGNGIDTANSNKLEKIGNLTLNQLSDIVDELGYDLSDLEDVELLMACSGGACTYCQGTCQNCKSGCISNS